jgi:HAE1 family hydrophobic/amphiphilic exporter-1
VESLYKSPLRVYLFLGALSLIGIWAGFQLPVSLFPNSSKPIVNVCLHYDSSADSFLQSYGRDLESQLQAISTDRVQLEKQTAQYDANRVCYRLEFRWQVPNREAKREVENVANGFSSRLPKDVRDSLQIYTSRSGTGVLFVSFYSPKRSITDVYKIIEPILTPQLSKVQDADSPGLFNPQQKQISVEFKPDAMAAFQLFPNDVAGVILQAMESYGGGSVTVGLQTIRIVFPRSVHSLEDLRRLQIPVRSGNVISLSDIARVDLANQTENTEIFKTSGSESLILFSSPKLGGNVKRMAEDILEIVEKSKVNFPPDIGYKKIVDPSEFIRSAVSNVMHEVFIAAGLAVLILFLFVGNLRNVATAAIEIPLSIILAFILMKISGMNLNLISLGGLALSAGMNVDASVVVMENIFRHFEGIDHPLDFSGRLRVVVAAVKEVRFAVIASTIASLVVFLPLAFTSELSYAILGDLAKAVVFSHGFSAIVALILVPTIRLQLMSASGGKHTDSLSVLDSLFKKTERLYGRALSAFLAHRIWQYASYAFLALLFVLLVTLVLPRLPREVIGKPDTDWIVISASTRGNTLLRQMDAQISSVEADLMKNFGSHIQYTFNEVWSENSGEVMARLKDKAEMHELWKQIDAHFTNTPLFTYWVDTWNPAELKIPEPPDMLISVRGNNSESMAAAANSINDDIMQVRAFPAASVDPDISPGQSIAVNAHLAQMPAIARAGAHWTVADLADMVRTATRGRHIADLDLGYESLPIFMQYPKGLLSSPEEVGALPISVGSKIIPLKGVADVVRSDVRPPISHENGHSVYYIRLHQSKGEEAKVPESVRKTTEIIEKWRTENAKMELAHPLKEGAAPTVTIEDAKKDLNDALRQLAFATFLSIALIFLTMVFQFGDIINSLLVLVAIPLGVIGVVLSLWVFHSTLSLNSLLGVILLNGISVANSIILVDFLQKEVRLGVEPALAAVHVAQLRLRPILMTSLTTALGMLPVALGFGEGGKIIQPLGISVVGGLGFSMLMTLFIVPALQVAYLQRKARPFEAPETRANPVGLR